MLSFSFFFPICSEILLLPNFDFVLTFILLADVCSFYFIVMCAICFWCVNYILLTSVVPITCLGFAHVMKFVWIVMRAVYGLQNTISAYYVWKKCILVTFYSFWKNLQLRPIVSIYSKNQMFIKLTIVTRVTSSLCVRKEKARQCYLIKLCFNTFVCGYIFVNTRCIFCVASVIFIYFFLFIFFSYFLLSL